jgi:SAM-dependent methyltransferase
MPNYLFNSCPICYSVKLKKIGDVSENDTEIKVPDKSAIVKCNHCNLIFVNPLPIWSEEDFSILYDDKYFKNEWSESNKKWLDIRENRNVPDRFNRIRKFLRSDISSFLEIGSGEFALMSRYLLKKNWKVIAQEPSKKISARLKQLYPTLKILNIDFISFSESNKFSLIYADSVFEHVHNPKEYIVKSASLLEKGGILYIIVPNEHSIINFILTKRNKLIGKPAHYLAPYKNPFHLIGFSKKSIEIVAKESDLELMAYIKRYDFLWFKFLESKKTILKYPFAFFLYLIDRFGMGTNTEIILRKI